MIDTHAHPQLFQDPIAQVQNAFDNNITEILCISTKITDFDILKKIQNNFGSNRIKIALGEHPLNDLHLLQEKDYQKLELFAKDKLINAIGELGFDSKGDYNEQIKSFDKQVDIAIRYNLPIILHTRESEEITMRKINEYPNLYGFFHCFTGSIKLLEFGLSKGWLISFAGLCTFKKNTEHFQQLMNIIPLDQLVLETDAPYLSPEPLRGRENQIQNIKYTYAFVAKHYNLSVNELIQITSSNYHKFLSK